MSKRDNRDRNQPSKAKAEQDAKPRVAPSASQPQSDLAAKPSNPNVKRHLRCPCCWNGLGGKALKRKWQRQVSGPLVQRCYVCDQCGAEWVVDVRVEESDGIEWVEIKTSQVRPPMPGT